MLHFIGKPSPAMVVACTALLFSLGGIGVAAVAIPANSVGPPQLRNGAVTSAKIANNAVTSPKIAGNAVTSAKIADNAVTSTKVADGSLLKADFKAGELNTASTVTTRTADGPALAGGLNVVSAAQAKCVGNERVIGGGVTWIGSSGGLDQAIVRHSFPIGDGWEASVFVFTGIARASVYALCASS